MSGGLVLALACAFIAIIYGVITSRSILALPAGNARMQEIAEEAGVNQALLHYYFRSKDRLAEAVFRDAAGRLHTGMSSSVAKAKEAAEAMGEDAESAGVVLAAVYALRLYIGAVHNRTGPRVESREISVREGLVIHGLAEGAEEEGAEVVLTVEVELTLNDPRHAGETVTGRAMVPSGASTGEGEALEMREGSKVPEERASAVVVDRALPSAEAEEWQDASERFVGFARPDAEATKPWKLQAVSPVDPPSSQRFQIPVWVIRRPEVMLAISRPPTQRKSMPCEPRARMKPREPPTATGSGACRTRRCARSPPTSAGSARNPSRICTRPSRGRRWPRCTALPTSWSSPRCATA